VAMCPMCASFAVAVPLAFRRYRRRGVQPEVVGMIILALTWTLAIH
jgi:hypothetical protein